MTIDERLATTGFPLPAIREVNMALHPTGISLGLGELKNFEPDKKILSSLKNSLNGPGVNYCPNAGITELREAVAASQQKEDGYGYSVNNVVITIGVQNAIYAAIKTLSKLGAKRVLIPEINFGIYKKIPAEFNLQVELYKLTDDYGVDTEHLKDIVRSDDIIIVNSPANPTGKVLSTAEMKDVAGVLNKRLTEGFVISDEIYGKLVYDGKPAKSFSNFFNRTIVVNGISKSGAAAGLRVGWVISRNAALAKAIVSNNASIISAPPTANQFAAIPVVTGQTTETITGYNRILKKNRDIVSSKLDDLDIPYVKPTGSFYLFADVENILGNRVKDFCIETAGKENGVVVIPGVAFGAPGMIRISLATNMIEEGMERLTGALNNFMIS
jgi:aspartate/methionine/tyrosine aminotransferase